MSYYWLRDDVICYKLGDELLTDVPNLSPTQIQLLINNNEIQNLGCINRFELPKEGLFLSLKVLHEKYLWEINNTDKHCLLVSEDRNVCESLKNIIQSVINIYLSDRTRNISFKIIGVDLNKGNNNFIYMSKNSPIKSTSHLIIEISNSVTFISLYVHILKGFVSRTYCFLGSINLNRTKIKRYIVENSLKEQTFMF